VRRITLPVVLGATAVTLFLGFLQKSPCFGPWDGRQYTLLCYSDLTPLYQGRGLDRGLLPYLEADNEYPVLTGGLMALGAVPARSANGFFTWNAVLLGMFGLVTGWALYRIAGPRALYYALAPTLLAYAFVNWDLLAVALSTLGTWAFLRDRDGPAGVALGLGAAAKLYPALLLIPFALGRLKERRPARILVLGGTALASWAAVNLPVALAAPDRWSEFFRFNAERPPDWDSLWYLAQERLGFALATETVNMAAPVLFVVVAGAAWVAASRLRPTFPAWTFGFPLLVAFLLTNKVYSPQFSLWLLPWFALALPHLGLFVAFSLTEVVVFVTRFWFFAELEGFDGVPFAAFEVSLLLRAGVLLACLAWWVVRPAPAPVEVEDR
jgi:uncharacterized membrane protein